MGTIGGSIFAALSVVVPVVAVVVIAVAVATVAVHYKMSKGWKQNYKDTELQNVDKDKISQKSHDKTLHGEEKNRYVKEEKVYGGRNRQKRENQKRNCGKKKKVKKEKKRY